MSGRVLLLLSGPIAVGKTTFAKQLIDVHGFMRIGSGDYLRQVAADRNLSRTSLQELGDSLDVETDFRWVVTDVTVPVVTGSPSTSRWLFDSVRKPRQIEHFRAQFGDSISHFHLTAAENTLRGRYEKRAASSDIPVPYGEAIKHPNELSSRSLFSYADLLIDLDQKTPSEAAAAAVRWLERRNGAPDNSH